MRRPFIAGNWKMNKTSAEAADIVSELKNLLAGIEDIEIAVCPPAVSLVKVGEIISGSNIKLGAQNMHWEESGAYTGEISAPMLKELGVSYVIIGHSERRQYFAETDQSVNRKVTTAINQGLKPIICVGETLEEYEAGQTKDKVKNQIKAALAGLQEGQVAELVIAYEPIWAIGTGKSATAGEANQVIGFIRQTVKELFPEAAGQVRILYGGSVKPHNIEELMQEEEIDGALVGGASLDAESFTQIIRNF